MWYNNSIRICQIHKTTFEIRAHSWVFNYSTLNQNTQLQSKAYIWARIRSQFYFSDTHWYSETSSEIYIAPKEKVQDPLQVMQISSHEQSTLQYVSEEFGIYITKRTKHTNTSLSSSLNFLTYAYIFTGSNEYSMGKSTQICFWFGWYYVHSLFLFWEVV